MLGTTRLTGPVALKATWLGATKLGARSERLGGYFAARLWFTPWEVQLSDWARKRETLWLKDAEPFEVAFGDEVISGFSAGAGPTILLVHGWGERAAAMGGFIAPLTEAGYRVVAVDLPGHGATTVRDTTFFDMADALERVVEDIGDIHALVAHSMGAVPSSLSILWGVRPSKVVYLAPAVRLEHAVDKFGFMYQLPGPAIAGLRSHIERHFGADIYDRVAVDAMASEFDIPALIVHDEDDAQIDVADGELLSSAWPGSRFVKTKGLGHTKVVRDDEVLGFVTDFLTREPIVETRSDREAVTA